MEMAITVVHLPGSVDLVAGLRRLDQVPDHALAELAPAGILGWGWALPDEDAPTPPWAGDGELAALEAGYEIPAELVGRFAAAARISVARCLEHAAALLSGGNRWFEDRIATRIPVAPSGVLVLCAEDAAGAGEDAAFCDILRLPSEVLPEVGRAMGVYGLRDLELSARIRP